MRMSKNTLQQTAYELIKTRIIQCEYKPGQFLNTLVLQEDFGFSRTPIREALGRLEQENLVKFYHKKGFVVSDVSLSTINTIYETRLLIEPHIVLHYGSLVNKNELERMRGLFRDGVNQSDGNAREYMAYDDEFHAVLRSVCPNIYLVQVLDNISAQAQRVRIISGYSGPKLQKLCQEHLEISEAVLDGRYAPAAKLMHRHLVRARKNAFLAPVLQNSQ